MLKEFFVKLKQNKNLELYKRGYDWAAGSLLRGEETPQSIEVKFFDKDKFDVGVEDACNRLIAEGVIEEDRFN